MLLVDGCIDFRPDNIHWISHHQQQQMAWESLQTADWTSNTLDYVLLHSFSRLVVTNFQIKRTLEYWATVQFFFCLSHVRWFWHCLWFRVVSYQGCDNCNPFPTYVAHETLTPASVHFLFSCLLLALCLETVCLSNPLKAFPPTLFSSSQVYMYTMALCKQPAFLVKAFSGSPSLWKVSMIIIWTTVKSAVFPMTVCTELDWNIHGIYTVWMAIIQYYNNLRYWVCEFH